MAILLLMELRLRRTRGNTLCANGMIFLSGVGMLHFLALVGTTLVCIGAIAICSPIVSAPDSLHSSHSKINMVRAIS